MGAMLRSNDSMTQCVAGFGVAGVGFEQTFMAGVASHFPIAFEAVEVRRRTRPMVCFVNVESVDRIIYSIFRRFSLEWKTRTLNLFTQAA